MWFERQRRTDGAGAATELDLEDLIAVQPQHVRGTLDEGQRGPGGERPGRGRAQSLDFDGISPYYPGDDVRRIDWRASARSGRTQTRRFSAHSHRARFVVLDLYPELYFGTHRRLMSKTAALAAARLIWEALAIQEPVGLIAPGCALQKPRRGRRHVLRLLDSIAMAYNAVANDNSDGIDLWTAISQASSVLNRGDEICVVTDRLRPDTATAEQSRQIGALRTLSLYSVDDDLMQGPLAGGHFPSRLTKGGPRHVFNVKELGADQIAAASQTVRADLQAVGWQVFRAADILPSTGQ